MKCLVLGGTGFIGSHLVDRLVAAGHSVRVFDKHPELFRAAVAGVDYRFGSFDNPLDMQGVLDGMETVFHLICTTLPKTSNDDPGFDVRSNLVPTLALLDLCVKAGVKKVVFLSSGGTVYGDPPALPVPENAEKQPSCSYGVTKLAVEKYLLYYEHQFGLTPVILRPSNVYGPRQNPKGIQGAVSVFLDRVGRGDGVEIWGDGSVVRDYIYVEDLGEAMLKAAVTKTQSRIFNIGSGRGHSLTELLALVEEITGKKAKTKFLESRAFDVKKIYLDCALAAKELNWNAGVGLNEGVGRTWEFLKGLKA